MSQRKPVVINDAVPDLSAKTEKSVIELSDSASIHVDRERRAELGRALRKLAIEIGGCILRANPGIDRQH